MDKYIEYRTCEVIQIEKERINNEILFDIFMEYPNRIVYVVENVMCKKVIGIISYGDFKRYLFDGDQLIKKKFFYVKRNLHIWDI